MPTIGTQPSLQSTQLVGAVLLHQFARDRFIEAGINEELIQEAEERENLDSLVSSTIDGLENRGDSIATDVEADTSSSTINDTSTFSKNSTALVNDSQVSNLQNVTTNSINQSCGVAQNNTTNDISNDQYHSMAESVGNLNNNTVYLSMNAGHSNGNSAAMNLERLQSSPAMTYYGRQLRLLAEEFEKDRKRLVVKDHANKVSRLHHQHQSIFIS